jgi:hypothetical protein
MNLEALARIGAQYRGEHDPGIGAVARVGSAQQMDRLVRAGRLWGGYRHGWRFSTARAGKVLADRKEFASS